MIASDRKALEVGSALLVVDGTDETLARKAELSIRPNRVQARSLQALRTLSTDSYNASIQHRRDAWKMAGVSVGAFDEFKEIDDELREARPDVSRYGIQPLRGAIRRADEAYQGFFRRVKDGETPGYPRLESRKRFRSIFYDEPVSWSLRRLDGKGPALYVQGVGEMKLSRSAVSQLKRLVARGGEPRTLVLSETPSGAWRAYVGFRNISAKRLDPSDEIGGLDRGITVTAALADGTLLVMPRFLKVAREQIAALQREREAHPKFSPEWKKLNRQVAKAYRKAHHQSENWARHAAIEIVARYGVISLERLGLENMTRSARGTMEKPGRNVKQKQGLNRSLQDAALGRLAFWVCVKAEEAGRRVWKVNAVSSSRECAACGHTEAGNRKGALFLCKSCAHRAHADVNAAEVLTSRGQVAEAAWRAMGMPLNHRPKPRLRRHKTDVGAGSAPYATAA